MQYATRHATRSFIKSPHSSNCQLPSYCLSMRVAKLSTHLHSKCQRWNRRAEPSSTAGVRTCNQHHATIHPSTPMKPSLWAARGKRSTSNKPGSTEYRAQVACPLLVQRWKVERGAINSNSAEVNTLNCRKTCRDTSRQALRDSGRTPLEAA